MTSFIRAHNFTNISNLSDDQIDIVISAYADYAAFYTAKEGIEYFKTNIKSLLSKGYLNFTRFMYSTTHGIGISPICNDPSYTEVSFDEIFCHYQNKKAEQMKKTTVFDLNEFISAVIGHKEDSTQHFFEDTKESVEKVFDKYRPIIKEFLKELEGSIFDSKKESKKPETKQEHSDFSFPLSELLREIYNKSQEYSQNHENSTYKTSTGHGTSQYSGGERSNPKVSGCAWEDLLAGGDLLPEKTILVFDLCYLTTNIQSYLEKYADNLSDAQFYSTLSFLAQMKEAGVEHVAFDAANHMPLTNKRKEWERFESKEAFINNLARTLESVENIFVVE